MHITITDVREKAKRLGIKSKKSSKTELIRKIQAKEGQKPCFQVVGGICENMDCCWRKECRIDIPGGSFRLIFIPKAMTS